MSQLYKLGYYTWIDYEMELAVHWKPNVYIMFHVVSVINSTIATYFNEQGVLFTGLLATVDLAAWL